MTSDPTNPVSRQGSKLVDDDLRARSLYRGVDSLGIECVRKESLSAILFESCSHQIEFISAVIGSCLIS